MRFWQNWFAQTKLGNGVVVDARGKQPKSDAVKPFLVLSASKQNQNFYRDSELARQSAGVFLTENFDFSTFDWDLNRVKKYFFGDQYANIFINYSPMYTSKLTFAKSDDCFLVGFVGDHYNFTDISESAIVKQQFYKSIPWNVIASAYPHTNYEVATALAIPEHIFIDFFWAIDPKVFSNLGLKRVYDIACMGAMTEGKYPFRRQVRTWLERHRALKLFKKKRVKGKAGSDHDGEAFNKSLNRCKSAFSCASVMQYTLMKYFEIPASGALLFAEHTAALTKLGYVDGVNFVEVTPQNFEEKMEYFLLGEGKAKFESIRQAGFELATKVNTWENRVAEFLRNIVAMQADMP